MTLEQKKEALQNGLTTYQFPAKYFIHTADKRLG